MRRLLNPRCLGTLLLFVCATAVLCAQNLPRSAPCSLSVSPGRIYSLNLTPYVSDAGNVAGLLLEARINGGPLLRLLLDSGAARIALDARASSRSGVAAPADLEKCLRRVIRGKDDVLRLALVSIFAKGHLLIEGVPGVGKTTLGQALARAIDCTFQRIQFTSDMLPSDVLGISIYSAIEQKFEFKRGPVFANVLLADEINRTTPKTQSALLEAMNEGQVTIDAHSYQLPQPFLVLATQNPIEHHGTYPLPESQQIGRASCRERV